MTSRAWLAAAGAALHVGILALPLAALGLLQRAYDPRIVVFMALTTGLVVAEILSQVPPAAEPGDSTEHHRDRVLARVTGLGLLALFGAGVVERASSSASIPLAVQAAGAGLLALGALLRAAAIRRLGAWFVPEARVVPGQPLVADGIYRVLRHPSETGLLAAGIGAAALLGSAAALGIWFFALLPASLARVRREDRVLGRAFPALHARYAAGVGALLPR